MTFTVFVSSSDGPEPGAPLVDSLLALGARVIRSPEPPSDPRWHGWYERGCADEVRCCDAFVAIVSFGYDSSTWMGHEAEVAWVSAARRGRPVTFVYRIVDRALAAGFRRFSEAAGELPRDPLAAAHAVLQRCRANALEWSVAAIRQRRGGIVRGGGSAEGDVLRAAAELALSSDPLTYSAVDRSTARAILVSRLHRDMAYGVEIMPRDDAERLADGFLDLTAEDARFYSNGMGAETVSGTTWMAATHATFDTGVIAVWADGSAVVWLEDED